MTGMVLVVGAIVVAIIGTRIVIPKRIDKQFLRLRGCGEEFLETLPQFPDEPG